MKYVSGFVGAALMMFLATSHARALTGTQLYQECLIKDHGPMDIACQSYIRGFVDGSVTATVIERDFAGQYCPPKDGIDAIQARLIVEKYLRDHPEELHAEAGLLVSGALLAAFSCSKKSK
jgi:Rap1a immunity proteins